MIVVETMLGMFMITDETHDVIAGPFMNQEEVREWFDKQGE